MYSHYFVSASVWGMMRPEQRCELVNKFGKAVVKKESVSAGMEQAGIVAGPSSSAKQLSVSASSSGIDKISLSTLEHNNYVDRSRRPD